MADKKVEIILEGKFENGKLIIDNLGKINKELDSAKKTTKTADKGLNSVNNTLKKIAKTVGLVFLAKKLKDLTKSTLRAAGSMEQYNIAFTTMLGSAEKAKKLMEDIIVFTKKTPFELEGTVIAAKRLLAIGVASEEVIGTLGMLGDIASGLNVPVSRLVKAFGDVRVATRLMGQDLNQFTQAGVPLIKELSKQLGVSEAQIKKLTSEGAISFEMVRQALQNMTGEGGKFFNLMEAQSKTFLGTVSNMNDVIFQLKVALGNVLLPVAKNTTDQLINFFEKLQNKIQENRVEIKAFVSDIVKAFQFVIANAIKPFFQGVVLLINGLRVLLSIPVAKWFIGIGLAIGTALSFLNPFQIAIGAIVILFGKFFNSVDKAKQSLISLQFVALTAAEKILSAFSLLENIPGFKWVKNAKKGLQELKDQAIETFNELEARLQEQAQQEETENPALDNEEFRQAQVEKLEIATKSQQDLLKLEQEFAEGKFELKAFEDEQEKIRREGQLAELNEWYLQQLKGQKLTDDQKLNLQKEYNKKRIALDKQTNVLEKLLENENVKNAKGAADDLVELQQSKHKSIAVVGKAAAIFQTTVDTASGAISAYKALAGIPVVGPALGATAAAAVTAFGVEKLGQIKAASFAVGTDELPSDQIIQAHRGEMIIPQSFADSIRGGELSLSGGVQQAQQGDDGQEREQRVKVEIDLTDRASELFTAEQFINQQLGIDR